MQERICLLLVILFGLCLPTLAFGANRDLADKKVLVVNSYHAASGSELKILEGIEQVLKGAEIRSFYLESKNNPEAGEAKAREAYDLYLEFKPDAVIAVDDNAQSLFVVPYLKGKVETPVIFCGVNDEATQYGYPTTHITGILEKKHFREGINFLRLIDPTVEKIAVLYKATPSNDANILQLKREMAEYPVAIKDFFAINDTTGLFATLTEVQDRVDAIIVLNLAGIVSGSGESLGSDAAMTLVAEKWQKPTVGASKREIIAGLLCGVVKLNVEQGVVAAQMVVDIFNGVSIKDIPVTENRNGQRMINVTTARRLGVDLTPIVLVGTNLVQ